MTQSSTIVVPTSDILPGDIILTNGMQCLVDQDVQSVPETDGPVWYTSTLVLNPGEVIGSGIVPRSWLYDHASTWGPNGWHIPDDAQPRWQIQGNDLARWSVRRQA